MVPVSYAYNELCMPCHCYYLAKCLNYHAYDNNEEVCRVTCRFINTLSLVAILFYYIHA